MSWIEEIHHDIALIQSTPHDLKKFGLSVGSLLLLLCAAAFFKGWWNSSAIFITGTVGVFLILSGVFYSQLLHTIHRLWMGFAIILGSVVSRIILFVVFFSAVTFISVAARIFKKKFYIEHKEQHRSTYWIQRDQNKPINYERMS